MSKTLTDFVEETKRDLAEFERKYREKMAENPEYYPESLPDDNEGLWLEFFITYLQSGEV
jgi:hypothetical protein